MRRILVLAAFAAAVGCGKKPAAPPPAEEETTEEQAAAEQSERERLLGLLKSKRGDPQRKAADDLAVLVESDPAVLDGLVELLRDKTNAGAGKTHPLNTGSTREAAALLLARCGTKGEAALKERGLP